MKKQIEGVEQFHKAFNQIVGTQPSLIEDKDYVLRYNLLAEENEEYLEACRNNDIVGIADAITDSLYIILGTAITHGMQHILEDCFTEVQASNMSKLDENGQPIVNGKNGVYDESRPLNKVLKSKLFREPNLKQFINDKFPTTIS